MGNEYLVPPFTLRSKISQNQRRGVTGKDRMLRAKNVKVSENLPLYPYILNSSFGNKISILYCLFEVGGRG